MLRGPVSGEFLGASPTHAQCAGAAGVCSLEVPNSKCALCINSVLQNVQFKKKHAIKVPVMWYANHTAQQNKNIFFSADFISCLHFPPLFLCS